MNKSTLFLAIPLLALGLSHAFAQTSSPSFEVASIKLDKSGSDQDRLTSTPDGFSATNISLQTLIAAAYNLKNPEVRDGLRGIPGAPKWIASDLYDIQAKMSESDAAAIHNLRSDQQWERQRLMLQTLLSDRFKLKLHTETKQGPTYDLIVTRAGTKLKQAADNSSTRYDSSRSHINFKATSISDLAAQLAHIVGRPVTDRTGLTGKFDYNLTWVPDHAAESQVGSNLDSGLDGPSIFTALQEQLGLKLESTKGPVETVVIDHIERPGEN